MSTRSFLGIDPGNTGGIAIINQHGEATTWKMPETERDMWDMIRDLATWNDAPTIAALEHVHAIPGSRISSVASFTFGKCYGLLRMALIGAGIPFRDVLSRVWQKELQCLTKGNKNVSKSKAQQLFPNIKVTHAIADALLIAEWLRRQP